MKALRSASLFLLTALAGTSAMAQPYLFVDVSPYHRPADAPETLVSNFGDLGVFGYGAVLPKSLPRLVPVIEEATSEGVKLRKLDAAPVLDASGVNACEGALFCAFTINPSEVDAVRAGGAVKVLLQTSDDVPEQVGDLDELAYFDANDCKVNEICPLTTAKGDRFTGEILIQDQPDRHCIANNSGYTRALYAAVGTANRAMAFNREIGKLGRSPDVPSVEFAVPIVVDLHAGGVESSHVVRQSMDRFAFCILPDSLAGYLSILNTQKSKNELMLVSAAAFQLVDQASTFKLKVRLPEADQDLLGELKKTGKVTKTYYSEHSAEIDMGDLVSALQESYESSAGTLVDTTAIGNLQMAMAMNAMTPGTPWAAETSLPTSRSLCAALVEQVGKEGRFKLNPQACK